MKRSILIILTTLLFATSLLAQVARIKGSVIDANTLETLLGSSVFLEGTTNGCMSDFDGNFEIKNIAPGTYNVICKFISYRPDTLRNIELTSNQEYTINFKMREAVEEIAEVKVIAKINRESENLLLLEQKQATMIANNIGATELARKGAGDVAAGVKKISGVSMIGSSQLFVRGLGDRYNSAQLNGLPITSPDPIKKIIKLDIFPSDIIKVLNVSKVYSASNYADYTGALINIETKDYPEDPFLSVSVGTGYNTNATFQPFSRMESKGFNFAGFDVNARKKLTPDIYKDINRLMEIGDDFNYQSYGYTTPRAIPNIDFSLKGGRLYEFNSHQEIGILASVSISNESIYLPDVVELTINKQKNSDGDFVNQEYSYNTLFTSLLNASYIHNKNNTIKYNLLFVNNGEDGLKEKEGYKRDWGEDELVLIRNAEYINYKLLSNQLTGKHHIADQLTLNWRTSIMNVSYDVPDRREIIFQENSDEEWEFFTLNNGNDTKRITVEQDGIELNSSVDISYQLNKEKGNVTAGILSRHKSQKYHSYFFGYEFNQSMIQDLVVDITNPNEFLTTEYITEIDANSGDDMGYEAQLDLQSGFIDFNYNISPKLSINAGLRAEYSQMLITSYTNVIDNDEVEYTYDKFDLFPAFNLKYGINEQTNLRVALSRTVTRPSFFEKSPARMIPEGGKKQTKGNTGTKDSPQSDGTYLENSYSNNIDVKYELFPNNGEVISLGVYYKKIIEPIEQVSTVMGGSDVIYTYRSFTDNALATGAELEIKKQFGGLFAGLNAAYIYTHIKVPEEASEINTERTLQGASPYLINADIGYQIKFGADKKNESYLGFSYNIFGKRLTSVGVSGAGNQYELPFNSLNIVFKNKIKKHLEINFSLKNILNQEFKIVQDVYTDLTQEDLITGREPISAYRPGMDATVNISYKF